MIPVMVKAGQVYRAPVISCRTGKLLAEKYVVVDEVRGAAGLEFDDHDPEAMPYVNAREVAEDGSKLAGRDRHGLKRNVSFRIQLTFVEGKAVLPSRYNLHRTKEGVHVIEAEAEVQPQAVTVHRARAKGVAKPKPQGAVGAGQPRVGHPARAEGGAGSGGGGGEVAAARTSAARKAWETRRARAAAAAVAK